MKTESLTTQASQHTPGPWIVDDRHIHTANGLTYPRGVEPETDVIALIDTDCHSRGLINDTDRANLRLIAAAPELLAALELTADSMEWAMAAFPDIPKQSEFANRLADARAAIARATQS